MQTCGAENGIRCSTAVLQTELTRFCPVSENVNHTLRLNFFIPKIRNQTNLISQVWKWTSDTGKINFDANSENQSGNICDWRRTFQPATPFGGACYSSSEHTGEESSLFSRVVCNDVFFLVQTSLLLGVYCLTCVCLVCFWQCFCCCSRMATVHTVKMAKDLSTTPKRFFAKVNIVWKWKKT